MGPRAGRESTVYTAGVAGGRGGTRVSMGLGRPSLWCGVGGIMVLQSQWTPTRCSDHRHLLNANDSV